ncbi:two pore calcium channel protein 1-like [Penaeus japonicus]|uniref:two pore calcium channel protein 1-like n=1 Tax=Penaeus japonicus TaxID=27405 RepID=UPI001C70DC1D|nr:two pore calcium channel protein 1-like [Penaeus japonicus]XP_042874482.1 two pore calcium channel protein 1-like [Penaeus japonicus]
MDALQRNKESLKVVIEETNDATEPSRVEEEGPKTPRAYHRRKSSLQLRRSTSEDDPGLPVSISYKAGDDTVEVSNLSDGSCAIDSTDEPPISDLNLLLAATYVEDARDGRHSDFRVSEKHLKLYHMYQSRWGQAALYVIIILHLSLALFEKPAVYGLEMSYWASMTIELGIICCYLFRLAHINLFTPVVRFWSDTKNILILVLSGLTFLDMVIYIGLVENDIYGVRWSRPLRPLFAVNFPEMKQIRRSFRNMRRTMPDVFNVLVLFFFSLAIFALMAYKLFGDRGLTWVDGRPYFATYWDSIFDLYVLVTTANNPDVMMPAFDASPYYVIFFVAFLIICFFVYMNIILAVIYNNYRKHLKNEVKKSVFSKRQQLQKAYDILSVKVLSRKLVTRNRFMQLMKTLDKKKNPALLNVLWIVLDGDRSDALDRVEFLKLADLLNVEVSEVVDRVPLIGHLLPKLYHSKPSRFVCRVVKHKAFQIFFDILTLINAIVIAIATPTSDWDEMTEWIFLGFFVLEIVLKLYVQGGSRFFRRMWNVFDFFVIGSAFIMAIVEEIKADDDDSRLALDVLLVLRVLRLVKIIGSIDRFKVIVHTISKIGPSLLTYGGVLLVFYYIFAMIGMETFQGLVKYSGYDIESGSELFCSNDKLEMTDFWRDHYCNNNFNDVVHAFIVLFELTVVNQWHVIAYGYSAVTNPWARLFFMLFHLICVIIVLNIFTAFVLEAFMLEYSATYGGKLESQLEKKIHEMGLSMKKKKKKTTISQEELVMESDSSDEGDEVDSPDDIRPENNAYVTQEGSSSFYQAPHNLSGETDVRFHISKKLKNVEVLLQKMFEKELEEDELGPDISNLDEDIDDQLHSFSTQGNSSWHG